MKPRAIGRNQEEVVGKALAELEREKIVLATKACWRFRDDGSRFADLSGDYLIEASLRRLGTDYIDLYQCHSYDPLVPPEELITALDKLKQQGKCAGLQPASRRAADRQIPRG